MRLGMNLPYAHPDGTPFSADELMTRARVIEDAGFDSIWIGDTVYRGGNVSPDPLMWLLTAALATKQVELGISVLQLPLREPFELAKRLATINGLTAGRFSLGVGAGSTKADFDAVGVDYDRRFTILSQYLPIIRKLCQGETVGTASLQAWKSPDGGPKMLIGAWASGPWVKRAARDYDGWLTSGMRTNGLKELREGIQRYRDAGGKRALIATVHFDLSAPSTHWSGEGAFDLIGGPEEAAERLQRVAELGYDDVLLTKMSGQTEADVIAASALLGKKA